MVTAMADQPLVMALANPDARDPCRTGAQAR